MSQCTWSRASKVLQYCHKIWEIKLFRTILFPSGKINKIYLSTYFLFIYLFIYLWIKKRKCFIIQFLNVQTQWLDYVAKRNKSQLSDFPFRSLENLFSQYTIWGIFWNRLISSVKYFRFVLKIVNKITQFFQMNHKHVLWTRPKLIQS